MFIAGIKLLLANESVEDSSAMENRKSVVTNNTKDNDVELRTLNPETVGGEMQGELDNEMVHKGNSFTKIRQDFALNQKEKIPI